MSQISTEIRSLISGTRLSIIARHLVDGFLVGMHSGTRRGTGTEFSQYRSYQPGDDIRLIDWKMYARSDRYYIKEADIETSVTIRFFLDSSASMLYEENGFTRFQYSSLLTAAFGTLAHQQGDGIALHIVNEENRVDLQDRRGKNQLNQFYNLLETAKCKSKWPDSSDWILECLTSRKRELWIVVSDMLDGTEAWKSFMKLGETFGHEIQFLQILGEKEINLDLGKIITVRDPESRSEKNIRTKSVRSRYLDNLQKYQDELSEAVTGKRSRLDLLTMDQPIAKALRIIVNRRGKI